MKVILLLSPLSMSQKQLRVLAAVSAGVAVSSILTGHNIFSSIYLFIDTQASDITGSIRRRIAKHNILGREGYISQDLGSSSTEINLSGKWIYENPPDDPLYNSIELALNTVLKNIGWNWIRLNVMKTIIRFKLPLILATDEFVGPVYIEEFTYGRTGGMPNVFNWRMRLTEVDPKLSQIGGIGSLITGVLHGNRGK